MATTFLELTNRLLRRLNEVTIVESDFQSVRSVQAMAKDAIVASVERINQAEREWPFNAVYGTQVLEVGKTGYDFPNDLRSVKWDSFHVKKNDTFNNNYTRLEFISRDYWDMYFKDKDYDALPSGLNVPNMVFENHGYGFGVSPSPDKAYTVEFEYFALSNVLTNYNDTSTIPSVFDEVIIQGALYHFYMFRSNTDQADRAEDRFKRELDEMRVNLVDKENTAWSGMLTKSHRSYGLPTGRMY